MPERQQGPWPGGGPTDPIEILSKHVGRTSQDSAPISGSRSTTGLGLEAISAFDRRAFGGLLISRITMVEGDALNTLDLVEPRDSAYAERALGRAIESSLRDRPIHVLTAEDFVLFKLLSTRDRDLADAESVTRNLGADLERERIEIELERLAGTIPEHDIKARWRCVLAGGN